MDGSMQGNDQPPMMQGIVIGGAAHGMIIPQMLAHAEKIELRRPDYVKPLTHANQKIADVAVDKDYYDVCTIYLKNADTAEPVPFGLVVLEGEKLTWAFSELVKGFAQNVINEMRAEKLN